MNTVEAKYPYPRSTSPFSPTLITRFPQLHLKLQFTDAVLTTPHGRDSHCFTSFPLPRNPRGPSANLLYTRTPIWPVFRSRKRLIDSIYSRRFNTIVLHRVAHGRDLRLCKRAIPSSQPLLHPRISFESLSALNTLLVLCNSYLQHTFAYPD